MSNWIKVGDDQFLNADHIAGVERNRATFEMESLVLLDSGKIVLVEDPPEKLIEKILEGENK